MRLSERAEYLRQLATVRERAWVVFDDARLATKGATLAAEDIHLALQVGAPEEYHSNIVAKAEELAEKAEATEQAAIQVFSAQAELVTLISEQLGRQGTGFKDSLDYLGYLAND